MNINDRRIAEMMCEGVYRANVYGEDGRLKRVHEARNVKTTSGKNRLMDMLLDGYDQLAPKADGDPSDPTWTKSLLHRVEDFGANVDGQCFGLEVVPWPSRYKSVWDASGSYGTTDGYIQQSTKSFFFNNNQQSYTRFPSGSQWNSYWCPGGDMQTGGYIIDLGLTPVSDETVTAANTDDWMNLVNFNAKWGSMVLKSSSGSTTYVENTHYQWRTGDGITKASIKIIDPALVGQSLKANYSWFDVPQVPIAGISVDMGGYSAWGYRTFWNAMCWSLDQGKSRTWPLFPNKSGNPTTQQWQGYLWDACWPGAFFAQAGNHCYFFNSLPWAVRNPTQLAWFGNQCDQDKYMCNLDLLTFRLPKPGFHAIGVGDGSGTPAASDTALFNLREKVAVEYKAKQSGSVVHHSAWLDFDQGNDITIREVGMFHPSKDDCYFKHDPYYEKSVAAGGAGLHDTHISGTYNGLLKLGQIDASDCDTLSSHAMWDTPWTKTSAERIELVYDIEITWG